MCCTLLLSNLLIKCYTTVWSIRLDFKRSIVHAGEKWRRKFKMENTLKCELGFFQVNSMTSLKTIYTNRNPRLSLKFRHTPWNFNNSYSTSKNFLNIPDFCGKAFITWIIFFIFTHTDFHQIFTGYFPCWTTTMYIRIHVHHKWSDIGACSRTKRHCELYIRTPGRSSLESYRWYHPHFWFVSDK